MPPAETQFGKYKLLAKIAAGGMAIAYRAELAGAAGVRKRVVLKVIHPHLAQEKNFIEMFISEAKLAASLTHGNIAQIFDFGQIDGRYYLSMEEVIGQPLSKVLKLARDRGFVRFPVPLALQVGIGVLDGLHYAHTRKDEKGQALNLVHRDVTPDNVLLSYEGEVKVVDFGIAKTSFSVDQTEAGMVRGKYPYLSPEQASGLRDLDARTDIWAMAVQLYDMLCGRRPYEGEFLHVMKDIVSTAPVPSMRALAPGLDPALEAIVMGALKKPRADRYATAREFSLALTSYLHQQYPTSTRQDVAFLLATLLPAEAAKEGADVTVPPSFALQLQQATSGASSHKPGPPVATEPPAPAQPAGGPRVTAASASNPPPLPFDEEEATSSGIEIDLEVSLKGLVVTDEEPTVHARLPPVPKAKLPPPPKKKTESSRRLKHIDSMPPRKVSAPVAPRAVTEPETAVGAEQDELPTLSGMPDPSAPPKVPATIEISQELSAANDIGSKPRRTSLIVAGVTVLLAGSAVGAYVMLKDVLNEPEKPKTTTVQLWVTSSPPGATFKVDGVVSGKTPATAVVPAGEHAVLVELAGYAPWSRTVQAVATENLNVPATLELVGTVAAPAESLDGSVVAVGPVPPGPAVEKPAEKPAEPAVGDDESHLLKGTVHSGTMRLAKMALPLDLYTPLRIELSPKSGYQVSTQGLVTLGPGRTTSTLIYYTETDGSGPVHVGLITPNPRAIRNAKALRVFAIDDDLGDNSGSMKVVLRISQYVPERIFTFDATKHVVVPKHEHMFRIEGLDESTQYLFSSRSEQAALNKSKDGKATEMVCISQSSKPRSLSKSAHVVTLGSKVTFEDSSALWCLFPDDTVDDNSGAADFEFVDANKAAAEGVNPKLYAPPGRW